MTDDIWEWIEPLNNPFIIFLFGIATGVALLLIVLYFHTDIPIGFFENTTNSSPLVDNFENIPLENIGGVQ